MAFSLKERPKSFCNITGCPILPESPPMVIAAEIIPSVYQLSGLRGTGVWDANVFLLVGNNLTLVDTGFLDMIDKA